MTIPGGPVDRPRLFRRTGLHYDNLDRIGSEDVVIASYPGSGAALLGNVLLELDLNYVNPATEVLDVDGGFHLAPGTGAYRGRLAATHHRDEADPAAPRRLLPRFSKTHLLPDEYAGRPLRATWLLVRDPRDAVLSWYEHRRRFAEPAWEQVEPTFGEFLDRPDYSGLRPVEDWYTFQARWLDGPRRPSVVLRFEDLKNPLTAADAVTAALATAGLPADRPSVSRALERSSYDSMRRHEDRAAAADPARPQARILRSGKVEGWRDWMTDELSEYFSGEALISWCRQFGYDRPPTVR